MEAGNLLPGGGGNGVPLAPTHLFGSGCSCLLAHPVPSFGTSETLGSLPLFSAFKLGRFAGGGIRRAMATLPRLCKPWRGVTAGERGAGLMHRSVIAVQSPPPLLFTVQLLLLLRVA